ncbi:MAG: flagellar basal body rod protein FlgC [Acidimicrobiales bacterium]
MSGPFHSIETARSGMDVYQYWLDAVADNIANINTVTSTDEAAFQERFVVAEAVTEGSRGAGARISRAEFGDAEGYLAYQPNHPLADEDGMIRRPAMELSDQMTNMLVAQRAYQANVSSFRAARDAYRTALEIGNG